MSEEIKVGDVVVLKSSGPKMTVDNIGKYDYNDFDSALCSWFDGMKTAEKVFPLHSLKKSESSTEEAFKATVIPQPSTRRTLYGKD